MSTAWLSMPDPKRRKDEGRPRSAALDLRARSSTSRRGSRASGDRVPEPGPPPRHATLALVVVGFLCFAALFVGATPAAAGSTCTTGAGTCPEISGETVASPPPAPGERWIEVDLDAHEVRLRVGSTILRSLPAATGRNDTPWTTTYPGDFRVYNMDRSFTYLPEWGVYIRDWVGFDPRWHNGLHSLPMDQRGRVIDDRVGEPVTSGCIRTGPSSLIYDFARIGMRVSVRGEPQPLREARKVPFLWLRIAL